MYNGIGLTTPRGSGTNGYVVRNLSHLRSHDTAADRANMDSAPMKHREPDKEILEHERKRKIEVACYELQVQLEDDGKTEEEIEAEVDALREKLLAQVNNMTRVRQQFKPSDTHAILAAKKTEMEKMARAFGTSASYAEGQAFDPAHAEEMKKERIAKREEKEREQEMKQKVREENERAWKEKERQRRRADDAARGGTRGKPAPKDAPFPPVAPRERRDRSKSPVTRRDFPSKQGSPPTRRDRSLPPRRVKSPPRSRSRSHSPAPKARRRSPSAPRKRGASPTVRGRTRTRSPPSARSDSRSPRDRNRRDTSMSGSASKSRSRSRSNRPSGRKRSYSRDRSSRSRSRSRSSYRSASRSRSRSRSYSPPRHGGRGRGRGGRYQSPPRRGGMRGGFKGGYKRRRSSSPEPTGGRRRSRSFSPGKRRQPSPPGRKRQPTSRSRSLPRNSGTRSDAKMDTGSPSGPRRAASPAKSEGSSAMDESE